MLNNQKGFSLVELLAIIFISSVVIWPIITTLVGNIEINDRLHDRRSASGIAASSLYGLDKMDWATIDGLVDIEDGLGNYYLEMDSTNCDILAIDDQALCGELFAGVFNNLILPSTHFKIYIYDHDLTDDAHASLIGSSLPQEVIDEITLITPVGAVAPSPGPNDDLLRVSIWIQYADDPVSVISVSGLIFNE